jgi:hypothetical protein
LSRYNDAADVCRIATKLTHDLKDLTFWFENGTWSQLDEHFGYIGQTLEAFTISFSRLEKELGGKYQNFDEIFAWDALVPKSAEVLADWQNYYNFEKVIVPALSNLHTIKQSVDFISKFRGFVSVQYAYNLHQYSNRRQDGGDATPPGVQAKEVMWHATVAYRAILREGFKLRSEQADASAGLGGSMETRRTEGISFTASRELAEGIAEAYRDMVKMLQGPKTEEAIKDYATRTLGLDYSEFTKNIRSLFSPAVGPDGVYTLDQVYNFVRYGLAFSDYAGVRFDPLFMDEGSSAEKLAKLDPQDIGIVEAVIATDNPDIGYYASMEEWRVPKAAILSYGPVGSQNA